MEINSLDKLLNSILSFSEEEFYHFDNKLLLQRRLDLLKFEHWIIGINGPKKIYSERADKMPIAIALLCSGERDWSIKIKTNSFLIASEKDTGNVHIARAFVDMKEKMPKRDRANIPKPKPETLCEKVAIITFVNAREKIPLKWENGKWAFSLLYFDWVSNSILINLIGEERQVPILPLSINPKPDTNNIQALPCYIPINKTPPLPKSGISFKFESQKKDDKYFITFYASFVLNARELHIPNVPVSYDFKGGRKENVAAIVPITLLILFKDNSLPMQIDLNVSVFGITVTENEEIRGYCAIEALKAAGISGLYPGEYVCYAVMDGVTYGPQKLELLY